LLYRVIIFGNILKNEKIILEFFERDVKSVHNFTLFNYFDVLLLNFVLPEHNIELPAIDIEI